MTPTYESLLVTILGLPRSATADQRKITWLEGSHRIGTSRTHDGHVEIFLAGERLQPNSALVRQNLEFQTWFRRSQEPPLEANRILLPAAGHFNQVAAFICTELFRNKADKELVTGFRCTEPVIELAISRLRISDEVVLGLAGELLLLEALLRHAPKGSVRRVLDSWAGFGRSVRDFRLGRPGT